MDLNKIKKKIQLAKDVVKDEDEPYKTESFKIVLAKLLEVSKDVSRNQSTSLEIGKEKAESKHTQKEVTSENFQSTRDIDTKMKKLAELGGLDLGELKDVLSIRDEKVDLLVTPQGKLGNRQRMAARCILIGHHVVLDHEWVDSKVLSESLKESGIADPGNNLAANLKAEAEIFRSRKNGTILDYKLTGGTGRQSAYETLKNLAEGENLNES